MQPSMELSPTINGAEPFWPYRGAHNSSTDCETQTSSGQSAQGGGGGDRQVAAEPISFDVIRAGTYQCLLDVRLVVQSWLRTAHCKCVPLTPTSPRPIISNFGYAVKIRKTRYWFCRRERVCKKLSSCAERGKTAVL